MTLILDGLDKWQSAFTTPRMLDVWSLVTARLARRVAFFAGSLFVLLPALASGQSTGVTATWDASPHSDQVSDYEVCIGTSSLSCNIHRVMVNQTSYAFAPPAGELVYVAVRASNHRGRGAYSTERKFSIPSFTVPTNHSTVVKAAITPISLNVSDPDGSPLTFTHTGLPFGVTMNPGTGRITGTPTTAGTYNVTIFVSDGLKTVSRSFVWTVTSGATVDRTTPALTITSHASGLVVTTARQTISGTATDNGKGGSGISAVRVNGQPAVGGNASASNTANWSKKITLSPGSNTITVDTVDGAGNIQMQQFTLLLGAGSSNNTSSSGSGGSSGGGTTSGGTSTSSGPLTIMPLTSSLASPQSAGTSVTFIAGATGGRGPYQFKWLVLKDTTWTVVSNWSSSNTYTWRPTSAGGHRVGVWARDATTTADVGNVNTSVPFRVREASAPPSVTPPSAPVSSPTPTSGLPQSAWTLAFVDSQDPSFSGAFLATNAFDGNPNTMWATQWYGWASAPPHEIRINLGSMNKVRGFRYLPRQDGFPDGRIAQYEFYVSVDGVNWGTPVAVGTLANVATEQEVAFAPKTGQYVRLRALSEVEGKPVTSLAELNVLTSGNLPPNGPLTITGLTSNLASPQSAGTSITFIAGATGGRGPYQFKWLVLKGTTWTVVRNWSSSNTYTWSPTTAGGHRVAVWARDATTTADVGNVNTSVPFRVR